MNKPALPRVASTRLRALLVMFISAALCGACGLGMSAEERLARAEEALASGDIRAAIIDARGILLDDPENGAARRVLGLASLAAGDGATAEKELRRAIDLDVPAAAALTVDLARAVLLQGRIREVVDEFDPASIEDADVRRDLQRVLADAHLGLRDAEAARDLYSVVLASDPTDAAAQHGIVRTYLVENNLAQAQATLSQVLDANPEFVPAWLTAGRLHMNSGDSTSAETAFLRAQELAEVSGSPAQRLEAIFGRAEAALAGNRIEDARRHSAALQELVPDSPSAMQIAARLAIVDQDWNLAQEKLTEVLRRAPANNVARTLLGAVHLETGNLGQAEMYLAATVADEPQNSHARRLLAETRLRLNKSEEAALALQPLLESGDADAQSLAMAARVSFMSGDFDRAASYLARSAERYPATANGQLDLAMAYLLAGRAEDAQATLDAMPDDDSADREFRRDALGVLTASSADGVDAALASAARLVEKWPDSAPAHALQGVILMSTNAKGMAREAFEAARQIDPQNISAIRYLARLEALEGNTASAMSLFQRILEINEADVQAMFALATIAARNENSEDAIDWLERARAVDPGALLPRVVLAELYGTIGRYDSAEEVAREALALNESVGSSHNVIGVSKLVGGETAAALQNFARAVELAPDNRNFRLNLARAQAAIGKPDEALTTLNSGDENPLALLDSGVLIVSLQAQSGDLTAAKQTALDLQRAHPESAVPIALEAEVLAKQGEYVEAVRAFDRALGVELVKWITLRASAVRQLTGRYDAAVPLQNYLNAHPLDVEIRLMLAQLHQQGDDIGAAIADYEQIIDTSPQNFVAVNNLAWLYFVNDDPRAEEMARQAHALAPDNASVVDTLGWILVNEDELDEGIALLREAVSLSAQPEIRFHLASALARSGGAREARRILQDILEEDDEFPSRADAQRLLASL